MQFTVVINQLSITRLFPSIDLKDAAIIDFLHRFFQTRYAAKSRIELGGLDYYWVTYDKLIAEMPLLKIDNERVMKRRIDKLVEAGILARHPECRELNKTYLAFTEASESIWSDGETYAPKSTEGYAPKSTEGYAPKSTYNHSNNINRQNQEEVPPSQAASSSLLPSANESTKQEQKERLVSFLQKEVKSRDFLQMTDGIDCDKPTIISRFADYWLGLERVFSGSEGDKRYAKNSFRVWFEAEKSNMANAEAQDNAKSTERLDDKTEKIFDVFYRYSPRKANDVQKQTVRALAKTLFKNGATLDDIELQISKIPHLGDQFRNIDSFFEKYERVCSIKPETWTGIKPQIKQIAIQ